MHFAWCRSTFLRLVKLLKIKERGPNFLGEPFLRNVWITWSPHLYFNFKSFMEPKFFVIHESSMHSAWFRSIFLRVLKFLQIKEGGPNIWGEPVFQKVLIIWSPLLYFNLKSFMDQNSPSFFWFECILHDARVLFSDSWNFYKLKTGDLISVGNQFCRMSELFRPPFCISILKDLWTQIHPNSLDFNAVCMMQEYFSQSL